LYKNYHCSVTS